MSSHLAVILSPSSGANNNEDLQNCLAKSFGTARDSEVRILLAGNREEIVELAERAIAEGADPIVAGGGNGTLNAVASVLVGTERTLGALPLGTLNHFAKDLNIPLELEDAVRTPIGVQWPKCAPRILPIPLKGGSGLRGWPGSRLRGPGHPFPALRS
ncbi:MAG TPA: diacylglycerol kinase family protein [Gammaproteobacteria bacterium]|nr:diacylglycerol kinase family protein [Gammaproteobacteria bacterium]